MLLIARSPVAGLLLPSAASCPTAHVLDGRMRAETCGANTSFNALLQSESFDAIKRNVDRLACLTGQFPGYQGTSSAAVTTEDLDAVLRLSGDIMTSLDKIALLREERPDLAKATGRAPSPSTSSSADHVWRAKLAHTPSPLAGAAKPRCRRCGIVDTPRWRTGPAGSRTLCNVCGLMHSKRAQRAATKARARRASP